jgi:hypothetical protein
MRGPGLLPLKLVSTSLTPASPGSFSCKSCARRQHRLDHRDLHVALSRATAARTTQSKSSPAGLRPTFRHDPEEAARGIRTSVPRIVNVESELDARVDPDQRRIGPKPARRRVRSVKSADVRGILSAGLAVITHRARWCRLSVRVPPTRSRPGDLVLAARQFAGQTSTRAWLYSRLRTASSTARSPSSCSTADRTSRALCARAHVAAAVPCVDV